MSHAGEGQGGVDPVTGREVGTPLSRAIFERLRTTPAPVSHVFALGVVLARQRDRRGRARAGDLGAVRLAATTTPASA